VNGPELLAAPTRARSTGPSSPRTRERVESAHDADTQELVGHLPIFAVTYLLLIRSAGIAPGEPLDKRRLEA
jgi:hypothetical protein